MRLIGFVLLLCAALPAAAVLALRWANPPTTAFMFAHRLKSDTPVRYEWRKLEQISASLAIAVVASEDQQFPLHHGFDVASIQKAIDASDAGWRLRGASTISQQTAKNLFLWSGRSFLRKGLEAWLTAYLEALLPKRRILEIYLNVIELGDGIYGVEAASRRYLHKPAARLNASEAALFAAVLPNPARLHIQNPSPYLQRRRDWILGQMSSLGGARYLASIGVPAAASGQSARAR